MVHALEILQMLGRNGGIGEGVVGSAPSRPKSRQRETQPPPEWAILEIMGELMQTLFPFLARPIDDFENSYKVATLRM